MCAKKYHFMPMVRFFRIEEIENPADCRDQRGFFMPVIQWIARFAVVWVTGFFMRVVFGLVVGFQW